MRRTLVLSILAATVIKATSKLANTALEQQQRLQQSKLFTKVFVEEEAQFQEMIYAGKKFEAGNVYFL